MARKAGELPDEAPIRALIEDWAFRGKDVEAAMRHYAADVVAFDFASPLQYTGADALRTSLAAWFPTFRGPVGYDICDLHVTTGEGVAFCRSLNRISGTRTDGEANGCLGPCHHRPVQDRRTWKVTHEHASVLLYMDGSYRPAIDLRP